MRLMGIPPSSASWNQIPGQRLPDSHGLTHDTSPTRILAPLLISKVDTCPHHRSNGSRKNVSSYGRDPNGVLRYPQRSRRLFAGPQTEPKSSEVVCSPTRPTKVILSLLGQMVRGWRMAQWTLKEWVRSRFQHTGCTSDCQLVASPMLIIGVCLKHPGQAWPLKEGCADRRHPHPHLPAAAIHMGNF
jgi:hypothetical protein